MTLADYAYLTAIIDRLNDRMREEYRAYRIFRRYCPEP